MEVGPSATIRRVSLEVGWSKAKQSVRKHARETAHVLLELAGAALLIIGAELVYHPAGYLIAGGAMIVISWRHQPL